METTLSELKRKLTLHLNEDFSKQGYSLNKADFIYKKKDSNRKAEYFFRFYDFRPDRIEFHFSFNFFFKDIDIEMSKFYAFVGEEYRPNGYIYIAEGNLHPSTSNLDSLKLRVAFTHIIREENDYQRELADLRDVLNNYFFPFDAKFKDSTSFRVRMAEDYSFTRKYSTWIYVAVSLISFDHEKAIHYLNYLKNELVEDPMLKGNYNKEMLEKLFFYANNFNR